LVVRALSLAPLPGDQARPLVIGGGVGFHNLHLVVRALVADGGVGVGERGDVEGIVPLDVETELLNCLLISAVVHLLEDH